MRCGQLGGATNAVGAQRALVLPARSKLYQRRERGLHDAGRRLEPLLQDLIRGDLSGWQHLIQNGLEYSAQFTMERKRVTIVAIWREILAG